MEENIDDLLLDLSRAARKVRLYLKDDSDRDTQIMLRNLGEAIWDLYSHFDWGETFAEE
jgi:hypothetical protein